MTELQQQAKLFQWHWNSFPDERGRLRRIKNELDNHPIKRPLDRIKQLAENKATGIVNGTPDFLYFSKSGFCFIEHKLERGILADEQKEFGILCLEFSVGYYITYGEANFKQTIYELRKER